MKAGKPRTIRILSGVPRVFKTRKSFSLNISTKDINSLNGQLCLSKKIKYFSKFKIYVMRIVKH